MARLLLVSTDPVGRRMAGPGVRYFEFARELASRHDVSLVIPGRPDVELEGIEVLEASRIPTGRFVRLARRFDAVVAQQLSTRTMHALAGETKVVYDLYDPLLIETLPLFADRPGERGRETAFSAVASTQLLALATGDAFLCASERQRDLWLGALSALGRIDVGAYAADPTLRALVDVVPFGLDPEPPAGGPPALRGVVPGIGADDRVLLWGGGIWSWFDPLTVIRAVARLAREHDDVRLLFLGTRHPNVTVGAMPMAARAAALARELGLEGRHVFFNEGWVEYGDRGRFLRESDLGVSAHFDNAETRFAFRTRLLDYFWAGLPTVTTRGDVLGDLVADRRLGRAVDYEDADAFAAAVGELLADEPARAEAQRNLVEVRRELAWPVVVERLERVVAAPPSLRPIRGTTRRALRATLLAVRASMLQEGTRAMLRRSVRTLRQPRIP